MAPKKILRSPTQNQTYVTPIKKSNKRVLEIASDSSDLEQVKKHQSSSSSENIPKKCEVTMTLTPNPSYSIGKIVPPIDLTNEEDDDDEEEITSILQNRDEEEKTMSVPNQNGTINLKRQASTLM